MRQWVVVLYFIDKLVLRVGNEKEDGEVVDIVGCCFFCVEYVQLYLEVDGCQYVVEFDFLGKDFICYYNRVLVEKFVYKNLQFFMKNKDFQDDFFDRFIMIILNKYFYELMDGLMVKVFWIYNVFVILQEQLWVLICVEDSIVVKILFYN